jgi:hypothetical protein
MTVGKAFYHYAGSSYTVPRGGGSGRRRPDAKFAWV